MNKTLDPSNFHRMVVESPDQFKTGFDLAKHVKVPGKYDKVVISGMGGSALPGDLLKIYLDDLYQTKKSKRIPIYLNRFYNLPPEAYDNALNIICSYSGNTEETIASFDEALKNKLPCAGVSSGGKIEKICTDNKIPYVKLPVPYPNFQPRLGTGYFIGVLLQILSNNGLIPDTSTEILKQTKKMKNDIERLEKEGKTLAKKIAGKTPVIYASDKFRAVAMVWKIKLNENSKTPAFWNYFAELNHNEMMGFTNPQADFVVLMLRDPEDNPKNLNRYIATAKILKEQKVDVVTLDLEGKDVFSKIFWSLTLGDFTSYYLAMQYKQDPTPVKTVEELKAMLTKMK